MSPAPPPFKQLKVAIVGGGLGGLSAAVALRRAGHLVSIYERRDFKLEVGASISCAANGTQWLREWGVDIASGRPIQLMKLVMREWKTGKILNQYSLDDYEKTWGNVYNMFHRVDMHTMLLETATQEEGEGTPCSVVVDHIAKELDHEKGTVTFENGITVQADLIIGADGIRSAVRSLIGAIPDTKSANQTCYRCNVKTEDIKRLGLVEWAADPGIQFWGGYPTDDLSMYYKIVMSPCAGGDIVSFYCFMPTEMTNHTQEGFQFAEVPVSDILAGAYSQLDPNCVDLIKNSIDRMPWRLYVHQPYTHWTKGNVAVLGDAAHPMMPHQSQGACMAIEDAAALGIIFSKDYGFTTDVEAGLAMYQQIRKPRATRVQNASARATENLNERIGFSSLSAPEAKLAAAENKLTVDEMNLYDMKAHVAKEVASKYSGSKAGNLQA
ncbi:hypothetical protein BCR35DRAFT_301762 [Leucosporidium creatinivorum]|uniref:FAD-binding domain-containing protein n=1 Tax=Leucosporidium creatinivorum TaxID=106004 RepID=A0A1Y2FW44_9BASI|nr:hypothetical protein BCR35DRAFT_301762 [Leucosporidium creatinivorum]